MKFIRVVICLLLTIAMVVSVGRVVSRKDSVEKYKGFYDQKEDFDVLFFGTSHVHNAISPLDLWNDYGIVSYNMANSGCRMATNYWMLKCALEYTEPKLVVIDCAYLFKDEKVNKKEGYMHKVFDAIPLSDTKVQAVYDLFDSNEKRMEFLFPFSVYHNRWNDICKEDFVINPNIAKGLVLKADSGSEQVPEVDIDMWEEVEGLSVEYLQRIVDLCDEKRIQLLLTFIPFVYSDQSRNDMAFLYHYADQGGIDYLDGNSLKSVIRETTDFCNSSKDNTHLNYSGAQKLTNYIGMYICDRYSIPDHRNDPEYQEWNGDYDTFRSYKIKLLKDQAELDKYLVLASDKHYSVITGPESMEKLQKEEKYRDLIENLNHDSLIREDCKYEQGPDADDDEFGFKITVMDKESNDIIDTAVFDIRSNLRKDN